MNIAPTIVAVPCASSTLWKLEQLTPLHDYPLRTRRLPEGPAKRREL
jgi:hypothetical protein